jgi:hypothetical protein
MAHDRDELPREVFHRLETARTVERVGPFLEHFAGVSQVVVRRAVVEMRLARH